MWSFQRLHFRLWLQDTRVRGFKPPGHGDLCPQATETSMSTHHLMAV